jgi:CopG family nickel-responsive transcriptional regulator
MSTIISASLDDEALATLEELRTNYGFSGRSETIRKAVQSLADEDASLTDLEDTVEAVVVLVHENAPVQDIIHASEEVVKTHLHNHLDTGNCLELFILRGNADRVTGLYRELKGEKSVAKSKITVV